MIIIKDVRPASVRRPPVNLPCHLDSTPETWNLIPRYRRDGNKSGPEWRRRSGQQDPWEGVASGTTWALLRGCLTNGCCSVVGRRPMACRCFIKKWLLAGPGRRRTEYIDDTSLAETLENRQGDLVRKWHLFFLNSLGQGFCFSRAF